ncbi:MAG: hypothetical protein JXM71_11610, partial [Spirochaetales bacterium]|nr:hypothetical protein [Spirochaetales bacterium]
MRRATSTISTAQIVRAPKDILTGLRIELDPKDVTTSGSLVTQFNNTNGVGGSCVQANAASQATLIANHESFANQPVVQFNGSSQAVGKWYDLPDLSALTAGEVFVVLNTDFVYYDAPPPSISYQGLWRIGAGTSTSYNVNTGYIADGFGATSRYIYGLHSPGLRTPHIYNVQSSPNAYSAWVSLQGSVYSNASNVVSFSNTPRVGVSTSTAFNGRIAYLAITDQVQSA